MKNLFKWAFSFQQAAIAYVRGTFGMVFCFQTVNILFDLRRCVTFCFASTAQFRNFLAPSGNPKFSHVFCTLRHTTATPPSAQYTRPYFITRMLQRLTDFLLKPFRSLTGGEIHPSNSLAVAHAFVQDFQLTYAQEDDTEADLPPFLPTKWDDVLRTSKTDGKFVLVYLHSNYHQHSQMFCEEALKDAGVLEFMHSGELLVWGANVSHRDGSEVAGYLKACSYPFMAVCMKHQSGALLVLDRVEGISSLGNDGSTTLGGKLLARLKDVVTRNQQVVSQVQAVNRAETERRTFRQQQDQEYENTLRADRERVRCVRVCSWCVRVCSCVFVCVRVCSCVFVCVHVKSMDILCWW